MTYSLHWEDLKHAAWRRSKGKCERCGEALKRGHAHLHHLTYARRGNELLADVQLICLNCHGAEHPNHNFVPISVQRDIAAKRKGLRSRRPAAKIYAPHEDPAFDRVTEMLKQREQQQRKSGPISKRRTGPNRY
jgi:hypothetical protein